MKYLRRLKIKLESGEYKNPLRGQAREPKQIFGVFRTLKDEAKETAIGVYLSHDLIVNSYEVLSVGSEYETVVAPDEVFRGAILTRSRYFIVIHNHPSGDAKPSPQDRAMMALLREQAAVMQRLMLDFIIVGQEGYWSMFEEADGGEYTLGAI